MRLGVLILILIATLFGSGFWYNQIAGACRLPLEYRIGEIDERFGTTKDELRAIAYKAERIWESELQKDIFTYNDDADIAINLIFAFNSGFDVNKTPKFGTGAISTKYIGFCLLALCNNCFARDIPSGYIVPG